jgi:TolB-like protein/tetratricopeptide (TPR) repeat protein
LKRRKVIQVAIAYAIVAWLVIQIVVAVKTPLHLPSWTDTLVIVLLAACFPIALVLAWMFDITPEGIKRTRDGEVSQSLPITARRIEFAILSLVVLAVGWLFYRSEFPSHDVTLKATNASVLRKSVAVLPFVNYSPNPDDAYFADGVHEEILNQLAKIKDLSVIARTSVMQYQNTKKTIGEIAKELHVGTVVEGSVRYDGSKHVRVTAQFIDAATDTHLWSEDYDRSLSDIFGIQTDIATRIATALEAQLSGTERASIEKIPTKSPDAYALYLKAGVTFGGTPQTVAQTQGYLDQAIALDPGFALAYAWKAMYYILPLGPAVGAVPEDQATRIEYVAQSRRNAERALAVDATLGVAYEALGWADQYDWKWDDAAVALKRAYELSPNAPTILASYGSYLVMSDRDRDQGLRLLRRAISLDPNGFAWRMALGTTLNMAGETREAAESFEKAIDLSPAKLQAHSALAVLKAADGDMAGAQREASTVELLWRNDARPSFVPNLLRAYRAAGKEDDARRIFNELSAMSKTQPVSAMTWFLAYQAMDDRENAIEWFQKAVTTHDTYGFDLYFIRTRNAFTALMWDDPRFQAARNTLGFD